MIEWSSQQQAALEKIEGWRRRRDRQIFILHGYAGTGKTTLARHAVEKFENPVFTSLSGKAASRLREVGCEGALHIHRLLYRLENGGGQRPDRELMVPTTDKPADPQHTRIKGDPRFRVEPDDKLLEADVIVVDEASMVSAEVVVDLINLGIPILALGDPAQLPPIHGDGPLTSAEPDVLLTEIHRQALDNPIIQLSMRAREGQRLQVGTYGNSYVMGLRLDGIANTHADQVLCGKHATRLALNQMIRLRRGYTSLFPEPGERLVCRTNLDADVLNGTIWHVHKVTFGVGQNSGREMIEVELDPEEGSPRRTFTRYSEQEFFRDFDFAYALTVHSAQGSEWNSVMVVDESWCWNGRRGGPNQQPNWLYTAITRARQRVCVARVPFARRRRP